MNKSVLNRICLNYSCDTVNTTGVSHLKTGNDTDDVM